MKTENCSCSSLVHIIASYNDTKTQGQPDSHFRSDLALKIFKIFYDSQLLFILCGRRIVFSGKY